MLQLDWSTRLNQEIAEEVIPSRRDHDRSSDITQQVARALLRLSVLPLFLDSSLWILNGCRPCGECAR
jgi:hypothetical protein